MTAIPKTLTVRQAMTETGFSRSQVYRLVHAGEWEAIKPNGQTASFRIFEDSITAWFERQRTTHRPVAAPAFDADQELPQIHQRVFA